MARQTRTSTAKTQEPPTPMAAFMASNGDGIGVALESQRAVMDGMAEIGQEMMTFVNRRFQEDMEVSRLLLECKTPEEAFDVQRRFAETATRAYFEEVRKVMELAAKVARDGWAPVERRTAEALKKANGRAG